MGMFKEPAWEGAPPELKDELSTGDIPLSSEVTGSQKLEEVESNQEEVIASFRATLRIIESFIERTAHSELVQDVEQNTEKTNRYIPTFSLEQTSILQREFEENIEKLKRNFQKVIKAESHVQAKKIIEDKGI